MFDPHRMDPLVQAHGCEEYGIMCPLEEVRSASIYKEVTDFKMREAVPDDLEPLPDERHPSKQKDLDIRLREPGTNNSSNMVPRSAEGSISEDVFIETELPPILKEEQQAFSDGLCQETSSGAFSESVQTPFQVEVSSSQAQGGAQSLVSQQEEPAAAKAEKNPQNTATVNDSQSSRGPEQLSVEKPPSTPTNATTSSTSQTQGPDNSSTSHPGSQRSANLSVPSTPQEDTDHGLETSKTDSVQQDEEEGCEEQTQKDDTHKSEGTGSAERRKHRTHKFLCLQVGKPMKKTFVSNASASMQQYAQQGKRNEYWFAVPQERSGHLYVFFKQWSPDMYGEGVRGMGQELGFRVVKKNVLSETSDNEPITEFNVKEWEITTKDEVNLKHGTSTKAELEPETFKPNLREPSELLEVNQIEKVQLHLSCTC
uniref:Uncharacterized protein n=1 Tax=Nothobranchius furzeri TaxID=105023 RepID=A0A8C6M7Z8_NOTFU